MPLRIIGTPSTLTWLGRFDDALRESERARQLDPLSLIIASDNGAILYYSRQYDRAIAQFLAVREMDPNFPRSYMIDAAYVQKGQCDAALTNVEKLRTFGESPVVLARNGHRLRLLRQANRGKASTE